MIAPLLYRERRAPELLPHDVNARLVPVLDGRWFYHLHCHRSWCDEAVTGFARDRASALWRGSNALPCARRRDRMDIMDRMGRGVAHDVLTEHAPGLHAVHDPYGFVALNRPGPADTITVDASTRWDTNRHYGAAAVTGAGWVRLVRDRWPRDAKRSSTAAELTAIWNGLDMLARGASVTVYCDNQAAVDAASEALSTGGIRKMVRTRAAWANPALLNDIRSLVRGRELDVRVMWRKRRSDEPSRAADTLARMASEPSFDRHRIGRYLRWVRSDERHTTSAWAYGDSSGQLLTLE